MATTKSKKTAVKPKVTPKAVPGMFRETKTRFGDVHQFLIDHNVVDGSSASLVEDLLDGTQADDKLIDIVVERIGGQTTQEAIKGLVYLALGGVAKFEIAMRLRSVLRSHGKDVRKALYTKDFKYLAKLHVDGKKANEDELITTGRSRLQAIKDVLALRGDHFLKRAIYVAQDYKIGRK